MAVEDKVKISKEVKTKLLKLHKTRKISLEGNILKLIDCEGDESFQIYVDDCIRKDKEKQQKRLNVTKKVQLQNAELTKLDKENGRVNRQLTKALELEEEAKLEAIKSKENALRAKEQAEKSKEEAIIAKDMAERAKIEAENAKASALNDLEILQKKTQFELMGKIVRVSLWVIAGVGVCVTSVYLYAMSHGFETEVIASTWSSMMAMLLSNAFAIVGTIMGIKHAMGKDS